MTAVDRPPFSFGISLMILYTAMLGLIVACILWLTGGLFSYSLDDPYIHLALAQHIAHGQYGINRGEYSSPSSSILWPFLLALFSHFRTIALVPLILNALLSLIVCFLLGCFYRRWYLGFNQRPSSWEHWTLALFFVVASNVVGLTLNGMEHVLQILLIVGCALGVLEAYDGQPISAIYLAMAILAPAVRYEDLAFTFGVCVACWLQGRRRIAVETFGASLLPLCGFALFLHAHGLAYLPNSVLVKGGLSASGTMGYRLLTMLKEHVHLLMFDPQTWPTSILAGVLVWVGTLQRQDRTRLHAIGAALLTIIAMMAFGPYGSGYRYDVCVRLFTLLIVFASLSSMRLLTPLRALALSGAASMLYFAALIHAPWAARHIALEQRQMARFFQDFYRADVGVNDLGWVSFNKSEDTNVLDLWGLASSEAIIPQTMKNAVWLDSITRKHRVGLVMIYTRWFQGIPVSWTAVAELHVRPSVFSDPHRACVTVYATPIADLPLMRSEIATFAASMPQDSYLVIPGHNAATSTK